MSRVLIIEDDRETRDALSVFLELEGYDVSCAPDGAQGLDEARRSHPDVILLDLMMPIMDGWGFRARQKLDPTIAAIPVVVVSALGRRDDIDAAEFVPKPCDLDEVLAIVARTDRAAPLRGLPNRA
jgi:DNA-binding response OmpR family regulator